MRKLAIVLVLLLLPLTPAQAQFCPGAAPYVFTDVLAGDTFCGFITRMATAGVTTGCRIIDANNREYCPDDFVTRKQMSAFMIRLADAQFPLTCNPGQVMKWNGLAWTCADDNLGGGGGGGTAIAFVQGGNAFGILPGSTAVLGTTDNNALEVRVNNRRILRLEPRTFSPNVIGGNLDNHATSGVRGATVGGGGVAFDDFDPDFVGAGPNRVTDAYGTVGGGAGNAAGDGLGTTLDRPFATVGGGRFNSASGAESTVAGGALNEAYGANSAIGGGTGNLASKFASTVAGGEGNEAAGAQAVVGGGFNNGALGIASVVGGGQSNQAAGDAATVPGGGVNVAAGQYSFAAGTRAKAMHDRSFVWSGDAAHDVASQAAGDFIVYAPARIRLYASTFNTGGCEIGVGDIGGNLQCSGVITAASFVPPSDRALKSDVVPADPSDVLARVVAMPIAEWSYTATPGVRHMGPMGQDFHAAFGLGATDKGIATVDADGVALAAIQGLNAKLEAKIAERDAEIARLNAKLDELRRSVETLANR